MTSRSSFPDAIYFQADDDSYFSDVPDLVDELFELPKVHRICTRNQFKPTFRCKTKSMGASEYKKVNVQKDKGTKQVTKSNQHPNKPKPAVTGITYYEKK